MELLLVIALGKPKEEVVIDDLTPEGDIKYWRDDGKVHHVPKRTLDELILLTTHGTLHLLGFDHAEPAEEREMFGLQRELIASFQATERRRRA